MRPGSRMCPTPLSHTGTLPTRWPRVCSTTASTSEDRERPSTRQPEPSRWHRGMPQRSPMRISATITIDVGNNIMPNVYLTIEWANNVTDRSFQELTVTTVPDQRTTLAAFDGAVTANDVVATARAFATAYNGTANRNDCHWMAMTIAAATGAPLDPATQEASPLMDALGTQYGCSSRARTRTAASGASSIADRAIRSTTGRRWCSRATSCAWAGPGGGFHTVLVTEGLNAAGQIRVVDNRRQATIGEHWVDFEAPRRWTTRSRSTGSRSTKDI